MSAILNTKLRKLAILTAMMTILAALVTPTATASDEEPESAETAPYCYGSGIDPCPMVVFGDWVTITMLYGYCSPTTLTYQQIYHGYKQFFVGYYDAENEFNEMQRGVMYTTTSEDTGNSCNGS